MRRARDVGKGPDIICSVSGGCIALHFLTHGFDIKFLHRYGTHVYQVQRREEADIDDRL